MKHAVRGLSCQPDHLLIDAMRLDLECAQTKIIHGDALSASIAAASIIAKVYRDALVREWAPVFPEYDLASNKGYSAPKHIKALREIGPSPLHRQSFAPGVDGFRPAGCPGVHAGGNCGDGGTRRSSRRRRVTGCQNKSKLNFASRSPSLGQDVHHHPVADRHIAKIESHFINPRRWPGLQAEYRCV